MRTLARFIVPLLVLFSSCAPPSSTPAAADSGVVATDTLAAGPRPWSPEGLLHQPRLADLRQRAESSLGYEPTSTAWTPASAAPPPELDADGRMSAGAPSPAAAMQLLVSSVGWDAMLGTDAWEYTLRIQTVDAASAEGVVMLWGLKDDAVAGHDFRAALRKVEDGGWVITDLWERFHCSRGASDEGRCQ